MTKKQIMYGAALHSEKMMCDVKKVTPAVERVDRKTLQRWYTEKTIQQIELDLDRNCLVLQMDINANYNKTMLEIKEELLAMGGQYYHEYVK